MDAYRVVVLAGGAGRRLGGAAKPTLAVAGQPMLARVLAAVGDAADRVVVGAPSLGGLVPSGVRVVQEQPPGGGPVAALAAGLAELGPAAGHPGQWQMPPDDPGGRPAGAAGGPGGSPMLAADVGGPVVVLAADLPMLTRAAVGLLLRSLGDHDGAVFVDGDGRRQWLCGAWSGVALAGRLAVLATTGPLAGRAMRELVSPLRVAGVPVDGGEQPPWYDCDTPADLADAERRLA